MYYDVVLTFARSDCKSQHSLFYSTWSTACLRTSWWCNHYVI